MQYFSGFKTDAYDQWFQHFPKNAFETAEVLCIFGLPATLRLLQRENSTFLQSVVFIVALWKRGEPALKVA